MRGASSPQRLGTAIGASTAVAWFVHLSVSYALVPGACRRGTALPLLVVSVVTVGVGVAAVVVAARARPDASRAGGPGRWRRARSAFQLDGSSGEPAGRIASSGLAIAAYFTFVVLLAALVPVLVDPCA